jgi:hypothetical protein
MKTEKERFTDNTYSLAKGLHHINIAKMYFEDLHRSTSGPVKQVFGQYILKCDWIYRNIYDRLGSESRESFRKEMSDSITIEAISDKIVRLDEKERLFIEDIMDAIIRGEEILVMDKENMPTS